MNSDFLNNAFYFGDPPEFPEPPAHPDFIEDCRGFNVGVNDFDPDYFKQAFMIDRDATFEYKSKDVLIPKYNRELSINHFSLTWARTAAVYIVRNMSKKPDPVEYTVEFFVGKSGTAILANCDCVARLMCKHIKRAWLVHSEAEKNGFVETLKTGEN